MTTTPALPQPRQWTTAESEPGCIVQCDTWFGESRLTLYYFTDGGSWFIKSKLGYWILPATVTTAEQAVAEAVVALSQHLDWLREELAAIPLTLPTTPAT